MADLDRLQAVLAKLTREEFDIVLAEVRAAERRGMERAKLAVQLAAVEIKPVDPYARFQFMAAIQAEIDKARALTPTDDGEYRDAVDKLMKEPG